MEKHLRSESISVPIENDTNFWKAIKLSIKKPHTIARKLAGAEIQAIFQCCSTEFNTHDDTIQRFYLFLKENKLDLVNGETIQNILHTFNNKINLIEIDKENFFNDDTVQQQHLYFLLSKLLPRNFKGDQFDFELVIFGKL